MTKEDNEDFHSSVKCWICDNNFLDGDVKVRDHCRCIAISLENIEVLHITIVKSVLN